MHLIIIIFICFLFSCSQQNSEIHKISEQKQVEEFKEPQIPFNPKHYICYRTEEPIVIDGKMTETSWQQTEWTDDFVDIEGDLKPKPRFRTRAKMLWDDQYFYIVSEMEEPFKLITMSLNSRSSNSLILFKADSTIAFGVLPNFSRRSFSIDPELIPILIGIEFFLHTSITAFMFSFEPILPGLILNLSTNGAHANASL